MLVFLGRGCHPWRLQAIELMLRCNAVGLYAHRPWVAANPPVAVLGGLRRKVIWAVYRRQVSEFFLLGYVWLRRWSRCFIRVASLVVFVTYHSTGCADAVIDGERE